MRAGDPAQRDRLLDAARGGAIIAMIAYHIIFDLNYFEILQVNTFFYNFAYPIAGSFIFIAGISLHLKARSIGFLSERRAVVVPFLARGLRILSLAAVITIATWIYPHQGFIIFGILHLIGLSTILAIPFLPLGRWNLIPAALILLIWILVFPITGPGYLIPLGAYPPGFYSLDYLPLIPWFSLILLGMAAGPFLYPKQAFREKKSRFLDLLALPGRNSLVIYLIHQPIIIGLLLLFTGAAP